MNNPKFIIQISKGLIRDHRARRMVMFYSVLLALVLLFAGSTFLGPLLNPHDHPFVFLGYWAACAWFTLLAVLLALYDVAKVRGEARRERRRLERELAEKGENQNPHGNN